MRTFIYIFCLLACHDLYAQSATGSWYGKADVEMSGMHNNYLTELDIKQKGNRVEGIFSYYFRDKFQSFFVHGRYNAATRQVTIENIPVIYVNSNSTVNSIDCNTNFVGVIIRSKLQSTLKGAFYHDERYKYTCPDIKVVYTLDRDEKLPDSLTASAARSNNSRIWKPQSDDFVVDETPKPRPAPATPPPPPVNAGSTLTTAVPAAKPIVDSPASTSTATKTMNRVDSPAVATAAPVIPADTAARAVQPDSAALAERTDKKKISDDYTKRKSNLTRELLIESDSVRLSFYDNGEIDGDSISVFVNNEVALTHQELAAKALTLYLHLDSTREVNEVSMFAENLGKYPPNTALMVVTDGKNRYEVYMSSSLTENATIRLVRAKTKPPAETK